MVARCKAVDTQITIYSESSICIDKAYIIRWLLQQNAWQKTESGQSVQQNVNGKKHIVDETKQNH